MMKLKAYQKRVVKDKRKLDEKIKNMRIFLETDAFYELHETEKNCLKRQAYMMEGYSHVLGERIGAFFDNPKR